MEYEAIIKLADAHSVEACIAVCVLGVCALVTITHVARSMFEALADIVCAPLETLQAVLTPPSRQDDTEDEDEA